MGKMQNSSCSEFTRYRYFCLLAFYNTVVVAGTLHKLKQCFRKRIQSKCYIYLWESAKIGKKIKKKKTLNEMIWDLTHDLLSNKDISVFYQYHVLLAFLINYSIFSACHNYVYLSFDVYLLKVCVSAKMSSHKGAILQYWIISNAFYIKLV